VDVNDPEHDDVIRRSFGRQTPLFEGPNSVVAQRTGNLAWIEPLDSDMIVLDVACGAGRGAEPVAARVRQLVLGIALTPALLSLGAQRLHENGVLTSSSKRGNAEDLPFVGQSFDVVSAEARYATSLIHKKPWPKWSGYVGPMAVSWCWTSSRPVRVFGSASVTCAGYSTPHTSEASCRPSWQSYYPAGLRGVC
jgi:hypothetical protein